MKAVTNNFKISGMDFEELKILPFSFIGVPGQLDIQIHECVGTEEERKAAFEEIAASFDQNKRASGFLTPIHSALHTYWYNVSSQREKHDIRGLKNVLKGKPVLYLGAGPSLTENLDEIKQIIEQDAAFVVTGGTGIKICHNNGIIPHLCLAVDPFEQEQERFEGLSEEWQKKTALLASGSLNPKCYEEWKGPLIAAEGLNCMPVGQFIEGDDIVSLNEGPVGVTTWMLEVIEYMGAQHLYLVGTDLCFGPSGETYGDDMDMTANEFVFVPDYEGRATRTNWILESNYLGLKIQEKGFKAANCSNGLTIPNTVKADLSDLFKQKKRGSTKIKLIKWKPEQYIKRRDQLAIFAEELLFTEDNLGDPKVFEQIGYEYLLKQYDQMQEYQYWRTGMYNYSLIREVCYKNAKLIKEILKGKKYKGELPVGHLGSPQSPGDKAQKKVRTGSKHRAEFHKEGGKDETVSSNSDSGKAG